MYALLVPVLMCLTISAMRKSGDFVTGIPVYFPVLPEKPADLIPDPQNGCAPLVDTNISSDTIMKRRAKVVVLVVAGAC